MTFLWPEQEYANFILADGVHVKAQGLEREPHELWMAAFLSFWLCAAFSRNVADMAVARH